MNMGHGQFVNKINSIKFSRKLIYIIFVAMFIFVILFGIVQYAFVRKYVIKQNKYAICQNYDQSYRLLTNIVDNYFSAISAIENIPDVNNIIYGKVKYDYANEREQLDMYRQYNNFCQNVYYIENVYEIDAINIYTMNGYNYNTDGIFKFSEEKIKGTRWYRQMEDDGINSLVCNSSYFDDDENETKGMIHYIRLIKSDEKYTDNIAAVRISIDENRIKTIMNSCKMTDNNIVLLRGNMNNIVYSGFESYGDEFLNVLYDYVDGCDEGISNFKYKNNDFYVLQRKIDFSGITFIDVIPKRDLLETYYDLNIKICIVLIIVFIGIIILLDNILKIFTQKLEMLMNAMNDAKKNKFTTVTVGKAGDDLDNCMLNYNDMICCIQTMMQERLQNRQILHNYEIRLLYEQINPHFLFNVLEIINSLTYENNIPAIRESIQELAQYYKISLNSASDAIKICDEIKHCELYVDICSKRFGQNIGFYYDVEDGLKDVHILKMILQPIAENAIIHGFKAKGGNIKNDCEIFVAVYRKNGYICIEVTDNGVGIEHDKLDHIFKDEKESGIGLKNTNERLKLYYGEECGLSIVSQVGRYTTVTIKITDKAN